MSGKPKLDTGEQHPADVPEIKALEYQPVTEERHPDHSVTPPKQSIEVSPENAAPAEEISSSSVDADEQTAVLAAVENELSAEAKTQVQPVKVAIEPGRKYRKKAEPVETGVGSASHAGAETAAAPQAPKSFNDEMAEVDAEVYALRRQLAKKLAEQNAQLRKMLARFDAR